MDEINPQLKGILHNTVACVEHCADSYPTGKVLHNNLHYKVKNKVKNVQCWLTPYVYSFFVVRRV